MEDSAVNLAAVAANALKCLFMIQPEHAHALEPQQKGQKLFRRNFQWLFPEQSRKLCFPASLVINGWGFNFQETSVIRNNKISSSLMEIVNLKQSFFIHKATLKVIMRFKSLTASRLPKIPANRDTPSMHHFGYRPSNVWTICSSWVFTKFSRVAVSRISDLF